MPEGDTIHKLAARLRPDLEGELLDTLWLRDRGEVAALAGSRVLEIAVLGKHLLLELEAPRAAATRWILHVHLGMHGRWERADPSGAWRRPIRQASLRLERGRPGLAGESIAWACFRAARAELLRPIDFAHHPTLTRLGPDLLAPALDLPAILRRARRHAPPSVTDLLLDQRIACGLGNVYRNEVLFLEGLHPATPFASLSDETLTRLYRRARTLMQTNLGAWRRTTTRVVSEAAPLRRGEPRTWVHGRHGQGCLRCPRAIRVTRTGDAARATWWCPGCQPVEARRDARSVPVAPGG